MNDRRDDMQLDEAYRRASAVDAGEPAADVRARIFAEAHAAARRRRPAANQSRYWMSAVAGVAVLAVSLVLLRQVDERLPGEDVGTVTVAPVGEEPVEQETDSAAREGDAWARAEVAPVTQAAEEALISPSVPTRPVPPPAPAPSSRAVAPTSPSVPAPDRQAPEALELSESGVTVQPPRDSDSTKATNEEMEQVQVQGTRIQGIAAPAQANAVANPAPSSAAELLRRHFPMQHASDRPHLLWLVRDAEGEVLRLGELNPSQSIAQLQGGIDATLGGRRVVQWRTWPLVNARGQAIQLSIGEAR